MKIGTRLGISFGTIVLLLLALGVISYLIFQSVGTATDELSKHNLTAIRASIEIERLTRECTLARHEYEGAPTESLKNEIMAHEAEMKTSLDAAAALASKYQDKALQDTTKAAQDAAQTWFKLFATFSQTVDNNRKLAASMDNDGVTLSTRIRDLLTLKENDYLQAQEKSRLAESMRNSIYGARFDRRGYALFQQTRFLESSEQQLKTLQDALRKLPALSTEEEKKGFASISAEVERYRKLAEEETKLLSATAAPAKQSAAKPTGPAGVGDDPGAKVRKELASVGERVSSQIESALASIEEQTQHAAALFFKISTANDILYRLRLRQKEYMLSTDEESDTRLWKELNKYADEFHQQYQQLFKLASSKSDRESVSNAKTLFDAYMANIHAWQNNRELLDLKVLPQMTVAGKALSESAIAAQKAAWGDAGQTDTEVREAIRTAEQVILIALSIGLLAGILLSLFTARNLTKPIVVITDFIQRASAGDVSRNSNYQNYIPKMYARQDELGEITRASAGLRTYIEAKTAEAEAIAGGDFTRAVKIASDRDQLGSAFDRMNQRLGNAIAAVVEVVAHVATGASQISSASRSLSEGATKSAASLEEITASMSQIGSQTKDNVDRAGQANHLAVAARESAERGNREIKDMAQAMHVIQDSSQKIAKIVKMIDDIAFQTNLLALNAAVEAARAGRHGKGFAVVAEEVRSLAGRSAKAAKETADLVETTVHNVNSGVEVTGRTEATLQEIVTQAVKVADLLGEINAASSEQAQGIMQVEIGLRQVDQVTQQNTANAEETAASAVDLSTEANRLRSLTEGFRITTAEGKKNIPAVTAKKLPQPPQASPARRLESAPRPAPAAAPASAPDDWAAPTVKTPPASADVVEPEIQIKLDDSEFGKF